jgi:hypothetical protein
VIIYIKLHARIQTTQNIGGHMMRTQCSHARKNIERKKQDSVNMLSSESCDIHLYKLYCCLAQLVGILYCNRKQTNNPFSLAKRVFINIYTVDKTAQPDVIGMQLLTIFTCKRIVIRFYNDQMPMVIENIIY